jgi:tetratricopeptide (TPR) repeat protein
VPMVGRDRERAVLLEALAATEDNGPHLVAITGEAGIGKSRLAAELAREAHARGHVILYGRSDPELALPLQPWVDALDEFVAVAPEEALAAVASRHGGELARVLSRLGERVSNLPSPRPPVGEEDRYALYAGLAALIGIAGAERPAVLVLDDLHWADRPSLLLLRRLLTSPPLPLLVAGTYREAEASAQLAELVAFTEREGRVTRVALAGLDEGEVAELVAETTGAPEDLRSALAAELRAETGGNPFFIGELLRSLGDGDRLAHTLREATVPQTIRQVVDDRVDGLGDRVARTLATAAVLGQEVRRDLVADALAMPPVEVEENLEAALGAGLLVTRGAAGAYAFAHALVARALRARIPPSRRTELHAAAARWLQESGAPAGEVAAHWLAAGEAPEADTVRSALRAAADEALSRSAPEEAMRWLELALEGSPEDDRPALFAALGEAQRQAGSPAYRETLLEACGLARERGDADALVAAALANHRGFYSRLGEPDPERIEALEAALDAVGEERTSDRARLLATLASELTFSGEWERRRALTNRALELARTSGDERLLLAVLNLRFVTIWTPETLAERSADAELGAELAERVGGPAERFRAAQWLATARAQSGDLSGALEANAREREIASTLAQPALEWTAAYDHANLLALAGELADAEREAERALELGRRTEQPEAIGFYANQLAAIRFEQGRLGELHPLLAEVAAAVPVKAFRAMLVLATLHLGLRDEATAMLRADAAQGFGDVPWDAAWDVTLAVYGQAAAELGEREPAAALRRLLAPWRDQAISPGVGGWGVVARVTGNLAFALGELDDARADLARAVELHDRMGAPLWAARSRVELARALVANGGTGELAAARSLLADAIRVAEERGLPALSARATALATLADSLGHRTSASAREGSGPIYVARREGEYWSIGQPDAPVRLRDTKGLRYLTRLLAEPGAEVAALELSGEGQAPGVADEPGEPILDPEAKRAYRERVAELREEVEAAEAMNDPERAASARAELDAIADQLAGAVGLGGRDRRTKTAAERARVAVTRRLRDAIARIGEHDAELGAHLDRSVRTGRLCAYAPEEPAPVWRVEP